MSNSTVELKKSWTATVYITLKVKYDGTPNSYFIEHKLLRRDFLFPPDAYALNQWIETLSSKFDILAATAPEVEEFFL